MKTGDIRKLLIDYYGGKEERIVVVLEETDTKYKLYSIDGIEFELRKSMILSENLVRNIPTETRSLLKDYAKLHQKLKLEEEKYEKAIRPLEDAMKKINTKTLRKSRGLLTMEEFINTFINFPPDYLQREMENSKYVCMQKTVWKLNIQSTLKNIFVKVVLCMRNTMAPFICVVAQRMIQTTRSI